METNQTTDEHFQALFETFKLQKLDIECKSKNAIKEICVNPECQYSSLKCIAEDCSFCNIHEYCSIKKLSGATSLIEKCFQKQKNFYQRILLIQNVAIEQIKRSTTKMLENVSYLEGLENQYKKYLFEIYKEKKYQNFSGKVANILYQQLQKLENSNRIDRLLLNYQNVSSIFVTRYVKTRTEQKFANSRFKKKLVESSRVLSSILCNSCRVLGNIERFINIHLKSIKNARLIFRASQHNFSAKKFHQICDNIPNTLTVIRNQFGKTFGGFTPLLWNQILNENKSYLKHDEAFKTCLLQFDSMQKLKLLKSDRAIICRNDYGPIFGNCDICITDSCQSVKKSQCKLSSFQQLNKNNKQNSQAFCGVDDESSYIVTEYEIFAIQFD